MKPILEVQAISKKFKIQPGRQPYLSLRDSVSNIFSRKDAGTEEYWALKDVSFDVYAGESIGIIGRNGAGKSTLLKILSKITPPTGGRIISRGRIASLLEVGTGFHSELTGRENIYLNGSILGLKRKEIDRQFEAIVDFSGVEKFLDTPLKHYSSGMQLRLAFAVAAHLEPEILIIDEVLAVGDAEFQKKCMGKMNEVSKGGRTILFVSHNMAAVKALCKKCIVIELGQIKLEAETSAAANYFLNEVLKTESIKSSEVFINPELNKNTLISFSKVALYNSKRKLQTDYNSDEEINVEISFEALEKLSGFRINIDLFNSEQILVFSTTNQDILPEELPKGAYKTEATLPANLLNEGYYTISLSSGIPGRSVLFYPTEVISFFVSGYYSGSKYRSEKWPGVVCPAIPWKLTK